MTKEKWLASMIAKHGSEDAVREFMRQSGAKGKKPGTGGFYNLKQSDPRKLSELSKAAARKRWDEAKNTTPDQEIAES